MFTNYSNSNVTLIPERSLRTSLLDLFFAGTDTISGTLHWSMLILATHPDIQQKLLNEIDCVIGHSRLPEGKDEVRMLYTQAFVNEVFRYTSIAPLAIFHSAMSNLQFHGFHIPKDSMVLINLYAAHFDKDYWGDPEIIRPERFLCNDGTMMIKHEAFFPFGHGKRICVGEAMARKEIFLFLTSILQKFKVNDDPEYPQPNLDAIVSFIRMPPNHRLVFEKRNNII